jgi:hypothetical protein
MLGGVVDQPQGMSVARLSNRIHRLRRGLALDDAQHRTTGVNLIRPQDVGDIHERDHALDGRAHRPVDLDRMAGAPRRGELVHDRLEAGAVDELERGEVDANVASPGAKHAEPGGESIGNDDVEAAEQRQPERAVQIGGLEHLERPAYPLDRRDVLLRPACKRDELNRSGTVGATIVVPLDCVPPR